VEELLAERGVTADHVTIYRWAQRFTPLLIDAARPRQHATGDRWFVDKNVKVTGRWVNLYRPIDQYWQVIDVLVSEKRDLGATRFFTRALQHGLKSRLRPRRDLKRLRSTRVISNGHAFVRNIRRGHYDTNWASMSTWVIGSRRPLPNSPSHLNEARQPLIPPLPAHGGHNPGPVIKSAVSYGRCVCGEAAQHGTVSE
jgi:hypothetical protein